MSWDPERDDDSWDEDDAGDALSLDPPPAIWPVFVGYGVAIAAIAGLQLVVGIGIAVWLLVNGANLNAIGDDLKDAIAWPSTLTAIASATQALIAAAALIGAWLSRDGIVKALGFGKPALPIYAWPIVILGAAAPAFLGVAFALGMAEILPQDLTLEKTIRRVTWASAAPFVLFISLTPGFIEEAFFRGYMQRRLLLRWSPLASILVSAALFALLHLDPHTIVFAFPLGVWLGVIAWRTGSIWPCIITHAAWNASAVSWSIGENLLGFPEYPPLIPSVVFGVLILGCFILSIWLLARATPLEPDDGIAYAAEVPHSPS